MFCESYMWTTRPPNDSLFQSDFFAKLDKLIGVTYNSSTNNTEIKNFSLDNWRKVLSNNILQIILGNIFCIEVNISLHYWLIYATNLWYFLTVEEKNIENEFYD